MNDQAKTDTNTDGTEHGDETEVDRYRTKLFNQVPLYTTRLVKEEVIRFSSRYSVKCPSDLVSVLQEYYGDKDREEFLLCLLDTAHTLISMSQISVGGLSSSIVEPRQIFKVAILANAAAIILVHNHPSGNPEPSREDILISKQLSEAGKTMGIPVRDHLIITDTGHTSLAERGYI